MSPYSAGVEWERVCILLGPERRTGVGTAGAFVQSTPAKASNRFV